MPPARNTSSNSAVNLLSRSRIKNLNDPGPLTQVHHQVPRLLGGPASGRIRGDTQDVYPAGGVLDDGEAIQPGERDRLSVEEVTGEDSLGLGTQELSPGRPRSARRRVDPGL